MSQSPSFKPLFAACGALIAASACTSLDAPGRIFTETPSAGGSGAQSSGNAGRAGSGSGPAAAGSTPVGIGGASAEGNLNPAVGLSGAAGQPDAGGSSGADPAEGAATAGVGGDTAGGGVATDGSGGAATPEPIDCNVIPAPSPLVGWAAVAGLGVQTTTGGGDLAPEVVTTIEQLQVAVQGDEPRVILVRGELEPGDLEIGSNKTIAGSCGAAIHGHLEFQESVNVIVRNLELVGYGEGDCSLDPDFDPTVGCSSGSDTITVQRNSHHVWFDHCSIRDGADGNLNITNGANFITVSWTKFSYLPRTDDEGNDSTGAAGHRYSNLVGGTNEPDEFDDENALNVTWHHDWWADNVVERQPRVRFGQNHLFNNYYNSLTTNYCVRAGIEARILLEGNFFDGVKDPHEFNNDDDEETASITADDSNTYELTTEDRLTGGGGPAFVDPPYTYTLDDAAGIPAAVTLGAGPH